MFYASVVMDYDNRAAQLNSPARSSRGQFIGRQSLLRGAYFFGRNAQADAQWLSCGMYVRKGKPPSHKPEISAGRPPFSMRARANHPSVPLGMNNPIFRVPVAAIEVDHAAPQLVGSVSNVASIPPRDMRPTLVARREMAKCRLVLGLPKREPK